MAKRTQSSGIGENVAGVAWTDGSSAVELCPARTREARVRRARAGGLVGSTIGELLFTAGTIRLTENNGRVA